MTPREHLTCKEIEVATLVWQGLTNREIANLTGTTEQVVKNHLRSTFDKLGVWSRLELAMYVASHGGQGWAEASGRRTPSSSDCSTVRETRSTTNFRSPV